MSSSQLHIAVYHLDRGGAFLLIMKWSASMFRFDAGFDRTSVQIVYSIALLVSLNGLRSLRRVSGRVEYTAALNHGDADTIAFALVAGPRR